jgi:hypothetical protein
MRSLYIQPKSPMERHLVALHIAIEVVAAIPNPPIGGAPLRCHEVARVVKHFIPGARVVDGLFHRNNAHSWLVFSNGDIIDPYCIHAFPQVQLRWEGNHAVKAYKEKRLSALHRPSGRPGLVKKLIKAVEDVLGEDAFFVKPRPLVPLKPLKKSLYNRMHVSERLARTEPVLGAPRKKPEVRRRRRSPRRGGASS